MALFIAIESAFDSIVGIFFADASNFRRVPYGTPDSFASAGTFISLVTMALFIAIESAFDSIVGIFFADAIQVIIRPSGAYVSQLGHAEVDEEKFRA